MGKCKTCGRDNAGGLKFCVQCGTSLEAPPKPPTLTLPGSGYRYTYLSIGVIFFSFFLYLLFYLYYFCSFILYFFVKLSISIINIYLFFKRHYSSLLPQPLPTLLKELNLNRNEIALQKNTNKKRNLLGKPRIG